MEAKKKILKQRLIFGAISTLIFICFVMSTCCYNVEADYTFHNQLEEDVQISLYSSGPNIKGNITHDIKTGNHVMIASLKTCDRDGFGDVIGNEVDSVKLWLLKDNTLLVIWRNSGESYYSENYENLPDFFDLWYWEKNRIQHGGSHAEYRYILELRDE